MKSKYVKAAELICREIALRQKADALLNQVKQLLNCGNGLCYGTCETPVGQGISFEVPLGDYLALYPKAKPVLKQWEYEGQTRVYLDYPDEFVGDGKGVRVWVSARTPCVDVAIETQKEAS